MSRFSTVRLVRAAAGISVTLLMMPAFAHPGTHHASVSLAAGFVHPFSGWDHLLALLAVGLWAAQQHGWVKLAMLLIFPLVMASAALAGVNNVQIPVTEIGVAGSVAAIVLLVAFAVRMPAWAATAIAALIAALHGYVHGIEAPAVASLLPYFAGFIASSLVLLFFGFATASLVRTAGAIRAERHAVPLHRV